MSQLGLIISNEYRTDIQAKSFWISTFIVPLVMMLFGGFAGYMMSESNTAMSMQDSLMGGSAEDFTALQAIGLMIGMMLTLFIMMYGSGIFQKVKTEKTNRIVEVIATCVPGRTMMMAKIISVGLIGLTQLFLWGLIIFVMIAGLLIVFPIDIPWEKVLHYDYVMAVVWSVLYFFGGYVFFGSLFAAAGAMTDKNNENQEYMTVLTMILLFSFYIGSYAVDHGTASFVKVLSFVPFTSPTIGAVNAITQASSLWESILSVIVLYACAWLSLSFAGKIYTASILLKGKKFTPKDIVTFLRSK